MVANVVVTDATTIDEGADIRTLGQSVRWAAMDRVRQPYSRLQSVQNDGFQWQM
jgi:hypothetical protein